MHYKAARRFVNRKLREQAAVSFAYVAILMTFLIVVRSTLRINLQSSREYSHHEKRAHAAPSAPPKLFPRDEGHVIAAKATDGLFDASMTRVATATEKGSVGFYDSLSKKLVKEGGEESFVLDSTVLTTTSATGSPASNAAPPPVVIALMNRFYFGERYARVVHGCTWEKTGESLPCEFTADQARLNDSSALA